MKEFGPVVSFRGARKVNSYLIRARLYPLERTVGSFKCNKTRCQVCQNVNETDTFSSTVTKKTSNQSQIKLQMLNLFANL